MEQTTPRKIEFGFFDAGGGHRAAATALQQVIQSQNRDWDVRLVNLQELMVEIDIAKKYGTEESGKFVNGVLDRVKLDLNRPLRTVSNPAE